MSRDLGAFTKRLRKCEGVAGSRETVSQPIIIYWGDAPAPGFEEMARQHAEATAAADSLEQQTGQPKSKLGKKDDQQ